VACRHPRRRGKVAGILVESDPSRGWAVLGIGINVAVPEDAFPEEVRGRAGTLGLSSAAIEPALDVLLKRLTYWLGADSAHIVKAVRARDVLKGHRITWLDDAGTAAGIDLDGQLMVDLGDGIEDTVAAGEVHLVRS
jgi:biotin-(acetyl-CoA carboxylase) ligase